MRFCLELLDSLGYFPGPGDRHVAEFFPEFFPGGPAADPRYGLDRMPVRAIVEEKATLRASLEAQASGAAPLDPALIAGEVGHSEEVVAIITAIVQDRGLRLYGNLPNRGLVANLPPEAIVEVPLVFGAYGWRAFGVGDLPASIVPYLARRVATVELTVEAALTGDRIVALQALLADGWVRSVAEGRALLDDLLRAQADYLPQFRPAQVAL
jgi:alpha-galactosidase